MKEIEKLLRNIIKKMGDKQAKYFYGVEYSQDTGADWRARIIPSKTGVPPFLAGAATEEKLIKELNKYLREGDIKNIAVAYCEAQIRLGEESIKFHQGLISDYEKLNEAPHS